MSKTDEFFQTMTDRVVAAFETAIDEGWDQPWVSIFGNAGLPTNAKTGNAYTGGNAIVFMFVGAERGYGSNLWATYRQWEGLGGQVRKGEKGVQGVKWVVTFRCQECGDSKGRPGPCPRPGHTSRRSMFPSVFTVFNLAQQDGYEVEPVALPPGSFVEGNEAIDAFLVRTGANIRHDGGNRASYKVGTNDISLPPVEAFLTTEGYYSTVLHELTHWTGHKDRVGREQANAFGSAKYAAEELVAEFGSVFLQAHFGVAPEPSMNSLSYLKGWLSFLRSDKGNLYKAAKFAQAATTFLLDLAGTEEEEAEAEAA